MDSKEAILMLKLICGYAISHEKLYTESDKIVEAVHKAIAALQSDSNAPDWSQAPDWAEWYAIDADGQCFWYENEPVKRGNNFFPSSGVEKLHYQKRTQTLFKRPE